MGNSRSSIAPEIIACIAEGRDPTVGELTRLADRIADEIWGSRSAFSWGTATSDGSVRLTSLRLAQAALVGECPDSSKAGPRQT